ncbi:hypothetical protein HYX06_02500 [Candidatus Woesearchaeota archaeon]|nr:hypothetical protein [Candidatus Woesearchaeota archaeon]
MQSYDSQSLEEKYTIESTFRELFLAKKPSSRRIRKLEKCLKECNGDLTTQINKLLFSEGGPKNIKKLHQQVNSKYGAKIFILTDGEKNLTNLSKEAEINTKNPIPEVKRCSDSFKSLGLFVISDYSTGPEIIYDKIDDFSEVIELIERVCAIRLKTIAKTIAEKTISKGVLKKYK